MIVGWTKLALVQSQSCCWVQAPFNLCYWFHPEKCKRTLHTSHWNHSTWVNKMMDYWEEDGDKLQIRDNIWRNFIWSCWCSNKVQQNLSLYTSKWEAHFKIKCHWDAENMNASGPKWFSLNNGSAVAMFLMDQGKTDIVDMLLQLHQHERAWCTVYAFKALHFLTYVLVMILSTLWWKMAMTHYNATAMLLIESVI